MIYFRLLALLIACAALSCVEPGNPPSSWPEAIDPRSTALEVKIARWHDRWIETDTALSIVRSQWCAKNLEGPKALMETWAQLAPYTALGYRITYAYDRFHGLAAMLRDTVSIRGYMTAGVPLVLDRFSLRYDAHLAARKAIEDIGHFRNDKRYRAALNGRFRTGQN